MKLEAAVLKSSRQSDDAEPEGERCQHEDTAVGESRVGYGGWREWRWLLGQVSCVRSLRELDDFDMRDDVNLCSGFCLDVQKLVDGRHGGSVLPGVDGGESFLGQPRGAESARGLVCLAC